MSKSHTSISKIHYKENRHCIVANQPNLKIIYRSQFTCVIGLQNILLRLLFPNLSVQFQYNHYAFIFLSFPPAFGLKTQILVQSPGYDGPTLGCFTEGWFPQPRMEWRDSQGEVVPYSSISYSQDEDRFFHMEMTLLLRNQSQKSITCCVLNPLTGEEKQTNLIIPSKYSVMTG